VARVRRQRTRDRLDHPPHRGVVRRRQPDRPPAETRT
jgi:hypothetical protein